MYPQIGSRPLCAASDMRENGRCTPPELVRRRGRGVQETMCATSLEFALAVGRGALAIALLSLCGYGVSRLTGDEAHDSASRLAMSLGIGISVVACCWLLGAVHRVLLWTALLAVVALGSEGW